MYEALDFTSDKAVGGTVVPGSYQQTTVWNISLSENNHLSGRATLCGAACGFRVSYGHYIFYYSILCHKLAH